MNRIDALALSIANLNSAFSEPDSEAFSTCNPGLLKAKTLEALGSANKDCTRIFPTVQGGYKALTNQIEKHCERHANWKLQDLLRQTFGIGNEFSIKAITDFVGLALDNHNVNGNTTLSFFTEH
jgi:hypothetical protein